MAASDYVWRDHVEAFRAAARHFKVFIAVRRTNARSMEYIPKAGYAAKRFDCKAKTADEDVFLDGRLYRTAGLVVDPTVVGARAFRPGKHANAMKEWGRFLPLLAQERHYTTLKRGYARGWEPVGFVRNVQTYAELLRWMVPDEAPSAAPGKEPAK